MDTTGRDPHAPRRRAPLADAAVSRRGGPPRLRPPRLFSFAGAVGCIVFSAAGSRAEEPLRILAAASTTGAMREAGGLFERATGTPVRLSFASSPALARQIQAGIPADVFVSANPQWMDVLEEEGRIVSATRADVLHNTLVLVAPRGRGFTARLERGFPLASSFSGRMALADPDHVPAGIYAREALEYLGAWREIEGRVVITLDVRAALALVERGECRAGIVYLTDALSSSAVDRIAGFPPESHTPIRYPAAALRAGRLERARQFLRFLASPEARAVFARHGFALPATDAPQRAPRPASGNPPAAAPAGFLSPREASALRLSVKVGILATLAALPPALAIGWLLARKRFVGKILLEAVVTMPLVIPPVVTGYLLLLAFGEQGVLGRMLDRLGLPIAFSWRGAALAAAVVGFPLMVRAIRLSVEAVDAGLEAAARTLGAGPMRVYFTVTFPLALPGILAGMLLCFARSLGEFGATITFVGNIQGETRTLPLAIFTHTQVPGEEGPALRLTVLSLVLALAALVVSETLARRSRRRVAD